MVCRRRRPPPSRRASSYGWRRRLIHIAGAAVCSGALLVGTAAPGARAENPVRIVALGDSLTAGLGLLERDGFVARLQRALAAKGIAAEIANAGVSGDTAAGGLARLDWSVPPGTEAVIVELGANDMLRGIGPDVTRAALDAILRRLAERRVAVLLCGMRAAPNMGPQYGRAFESVFAELAAKFDVPFYPFFLDGVAADPTFLQGDRLHPNAAGVEAIVTRILPKVEELVARVRARRGP
jgi:acyl-CoA thioesterase-1